MPRQGTTNRPRTPVGNGIRETASSFSVRQGKRTGAEAFAIAEDYLKDPNRTAVLFQCALEKEWSYVFISRQVKEVKVPAKCSALSDHEDLAMSLHDWLKEKDTTGFTDRSQRIYYRILGDKRKIYHEKVRRRRSAAVYHLNPRFNK